MPDEAPSATSTAPGALLLNDRAVAELLSIERRTIWRMLSAGDLPKPVRLPNTRMTRWRRADIEAWIAGLEPETDS